MYYEYNAINGKVLFNLKTFTYGNTILSNKDLSTKLITLNLKEAQQYSQEYDSILQEIIKSEPKKSIKSIEPLLEEEPRKTSLELLRLKVLQDDTSSRENIEIIKHE